MTITEWIIVVVLFVISLAVGIYGIFSPTSTNNSDDNSSGSSSKYPAIYYHGRTPVPYTNQQIEFGEWETPYSGIAINFPSSVIRGFTSENISTNGPTLTTAGDYLITFDVSMKAYGDNILDNSFGAPKTFISIGDPTNDTDSDQNGVPDRVKYQHVEREPVLDDAGFVNASGTYMYRKQDDNSEQLRIMVFHISSVNVILEVWSASLLVEKKF